MDGFGRVHTALRVSLTDRCSLRCDYCMPELGNVWLARDSLIAAAEVEEVVRVAVSMGVDRVRLTGGEPLLRRDLEEVVRRLGRIGSPDRPLEVSMTTNGIGLEDRIDALVSAGLARVNVSLDTLDPETFARSTKRDRLGDVLRGLDAAAASTLPLKINAVAQRGVNDTEIVGLVEAALDRGAELRFIEQMPLDIGHRWDPATLLDRAEILDRLSGRWRLTPVPGRGSAPAERFLLDDGPGTVGVIASVSAPFCGACDRLRLTADGQLRSCLFSRTEHDLLTDLRGEQDPVKRAEVVERVLRACVGSKQAGHGIGDAEFLQPRRGMNAIGG